MEYDPQEYWRSRHGFWAYKSDSQLRRNGSQTLENGENDPTNPRCKAIADHVVRELLEAQGRSLLDVGCAAGRLSECVLAELKRLRFLGVSNASIQEWTGVDLSEVALEHAARRLKPLAHSVQTIAVDGSGSWPTIPIHDLSVCIDVLYHAASESAHNLLIENALHHTRKTALFVTWKSVMSEAKDLGAHNTYYPFPVMEGWGVQSYDLPVYETSILHVLRKKK